MLSPCRDGGSWPIKLSSSSAFSFSTAAEILLTANSAHNGHSVSRLPSSFAVTLWLLYHRIFKLQFADAHLKLSKRKASVTGYDTKSLKLVMTHYWHRLLGTAGGWFCNDFFFYGNKIFQSVFIKILDPNATVIGGWNWNLLNVGCALVGYYMAAILVDHKFYGRKRMQAIGFLAIFVLFIIPAIMYDTLTKPGPGIKAFQFPYFFSSFWSQFGPNGTTFLLAAELYPAPVRATAHGFSAACGKLGALVPAVIYNYTGNHEKFWIVTWFGLLGFALTVLFIADTTGLDLREQKDTGCAFEKVANKIIMASQFILVI